MSGAAVGLVFFPGQGRVPALPTCLLHHPADVAGGRGEVARELLNLHAVPATVLEPRLLELRKRIDPLVRWLARQ